MTDPTDYLWTAPTIATARLRAATLARMTGRAALIIAGPACFFVMADRAHWSDGLSPRASVAERMSLTKADALLVAHAAAMIDKTAKPKNRKESKP